MRAAFYEKDITPPLGGYLAGYYVNYTAQDVLDPLYVRSAVFEKDGTAAAVIDVDSCELPDDMHDAVTSRIREYTGIPAENVLLSVNHTHKGIPVMDSPELNAFGDRAFRDVVYRLIADCVILAWKRLYEADLSFGEGFARGISFNRTFVMADGTLRTNVFDGSAVRSLGGIIENVPALFVRDKAGNPRGAVLSFACHQDCLPGAVYSGEFGYVLAKELKKRYGEDFVTVFLPGPSGDINHIDPKSGGAMPADTYIHMGRVLRDAVVEAEARAVPVSDGLWVRKELLEVRLRKYTREETFAEIRRLADEGDLTAIRNLVYYVTCQKEDTKKVWVQCIRLGETAVYAFPGEVFADFGIDLMKRSPTEKNIIGTLCNSGCGYIATRAAFGEASRLYEKSLCYDACLDPEAGYQITDKLLELAQGLFAQP